MDKQQIEKVARAMHEAIRQSPLLWRITGAWEDLGPKWQSEYRAVAHSTLVAAGVEHVWVVTDESDRGDRTESSVILVADPREAALALLPQSYGGAEDCVWTQRSDIDWHTMYGEYPWVLQRQTLQRDG